MKPRYSRTCCTNFPISSQVITRYLKPGVVLSVCDLTEQQQKDFLYLGHFVNIK